VRAEGKAEVLTQQVDSLRQVADDAIAFVAHGDSTATQQRVLIEAQQKQITEVAAAARRQTQVVVASLRETLDSAQRNMLDNIEVGYNQQLAAKDSMYAAQVRLTELANGRVASRDLAFAKIQQANQVVYDAWQYEKKRAAPGLITKAIRAIPVVATAVGLTLLITK